jgi:hypothetical protein
MKTGESMPCPRCGTPVWLVRVSVPHDMIYWRHYRAGNCEWRCRDEQPDIQPVAPARV